MNSSIETRLPHLLHLSSQIIEEMFAREMADHDITMRQVVLLVALSENPSASQTALVASTGIDRSTLADMVKRLLKKGMLTRRRSPADARAYEVKITARGEQIATAGKATLEHVEAKFVEHISERQFEAIQTGLMRAVQATVTSEN